MDGLDGDVWAQLQASCPHMRWMPVRGSFEQPWVEKLELMDWLGNGRVNRHAGYFFVLDRHCLRPMSLGAA